MSRASQQGFGIFKRKIKQANNSNDKSWHFFLNDILPVNLNLWYFWVHSRELNFRTIFIFGIKVLTPWGSGHFKGCEVLPHSPEAESGWWLSESILQSEILSLKIKAKYVAVRKSWRQEGRVGFLHAEFHLEVWVNFGLVNFVNFVCHICVWSFSYLVNDSILATFLLWIGIFSNPLLKTSNGVRNHFCLFCKVRFSLVDIESFNPTVFLRELLSRWELRFRCFLKNMTAATKQNSMIYHDSKVRW